MAALDCAGTMALLGHHQALELLLPGVIYGQVCARHKASTRDTLQGQGLHPTALLRQGSVVEVSRVEVTDGKRGPQGCPPTHTHTA